MIQLPHYRPRLGALGFGLLWVASPLAAQRSDLPAAEQAIVKAVDAQGRQAVALLERIVNINSGSMNLAGVRAVGAVLRAELDSLGFVTRWEDGTPYQRAGHLIAERTGTGPRLLLIGHLDTVFEPDSPFQHFEMVDATHARGPGVIDMKGGDVIIVQALKALRDAGQLDRMSITVVMHGDEEHSGEPIGLARRALIEAARTADIAIGFEDGDGDPKTAVIARRGTSSWLLETTGTAGHSSQVFRPDIGAGAIYEAARVVNGFRERMAGEQYLTFNPGVILGGTAATLDVENARGTAFGKTNVIAAEAVVSGDLRTLAPEQLARAKATMEEIVSQPLPGTHSTITFDDGYPPMAPTDGNRRLLARFDEVSRDLGFGPVTPVDPGAAGAADVSFTAGLVTMAMDGLGLSGRDGHSAQETADLSTIPMLTKRAAVLFHRLTSPPTP
jgi:glutamate carboxypeptidase